MSATGLAFGVCVDLQRPWSEIRSIGMTADTTGWHSIYLPDHFMPHHPAGQSTDGPVLEAWSCLAALAILTRRVRIGTLVLGNAYRHPAVVANMAATVDQLSAGRLTLGLGAGWQPNEHHAYGIPLPPARERLDRFEEAVAVIRALTRDCPVTFSGRYYTLIDARCDPAPAQPALPILIGGAGEVRMLPIIARHADAWHMWGTSADLRRKSRILDQLCSAANRAPAEIRRTSGAVIDMGRPHRQSRVDPDDGGTIVGTADDIAQTIDQYRQAGIQEFIVRDSADTPVRAATEFLSRFQQDVAPLLVR